MTTERARKLAAAIGGFDTLRGVGADKPQHHERLPHAITTPDYPALVADALRQFPLGEYTEDQIVGKIMKARGGNADPIKIRHEIRRQAKD